MMTSLSLGLDDLGRHQAVAVVDRGAYIQVYAVGLTCETSCTVAANTTRADSPDTAS